MDLAQIDMMQYEIDSRMDMQTAEITQRESEFSRSLGLSERQFSEQQSQFAAQMTEQTAARLQQDTQFTTALESDQEQAALERGLRSRALDLQEQGMGIDAAFRRAQQEFEYGYTDDDGTVHLGYQDKVLQLQADGMDRDDAIRWATLEADKDYRAEVTRLQELGLTNANAHFEAEMNLRQNALDQEMQMFGEQLQFNREQMWADDAYRGRVLDLQERGLDEQVAARYAEMEYKERALQQQQNQFMDELQFRRDNAETAEAQFEQMYMLWQNYFGTSDGEDNTYSPTINIYGGGTTDGTTTGGDGGLPDGIEYPTAPTEDGSAWHWDSNIGNWVSDSGQEYNE